MWRLLNNNIYCAEMELLKTNQIHFEKLLCAKSKINTRAKKTPFFLINKSYLRELARTRNAEINSINNLMTKKFKFVKRNPSLYSREINTPKYCPAFDKLRFNFSKIERERQIYLENLSFYNRFKDRKPAYSTKNLLKKSEYEKHLRKNIARSTELQKFSLNLCTFRQFKENLMKDSPKFHEKINGLNETVFSDNLPNIISIENPNSFSMEINLNSDNINSISIKEICKNKSKFKLAHIREKFHDTKNINSKTIQYKFL